MLTKAQRRSKQPLRRGCSQSALSERAVWVHSGPSREAMLTSQASVSQSCPRSSSLPPRFIRALIGVCISPDAPAIRTRQQLPASSPTRSTLLSPATYRSREVNRKRCPDTRSSRENRARADQDDTNRITTQATTPTKGDAGRNASSTGTPPRPTQLCLLRKAVASCLGTRRPRLRSRVLEPRPSRCRVSMLQLSAAERSRHEMLGVSRRIASQLSHFQHGRRCSGTGISHPIAP